MSFCRRSGYLPRVLVLAPTRELAKQVEKEIKESAPYLSTVCVYGGVSYITQQSALSRGVDVVVGTPGRLIDLINGGSVKLGEVQYLVLDEADQMLAVGFEEDVETILQRLPSQRQSMLFSATMPSWVKKLARKYLDNPLTIDLVNFLILGFFLFFVKFRTFIICMGHGALHKICLLNIETNRICSLLKLCVRCLRLSLHYRK